MANQPAETSGSVEEASPMQSEKDRYTTGGDPNLLHARLLGSGAFGEVHEVKHLAINVDR